MNAFIKWKVALYLTAIFAAGGLTGWMVGTKTTKEKMLRPPRPEDIASHIRREFHQELNLNPDQTAKVDAIIEQNSKEMKSLFDAHLQRVRVVVSNRNTQITALLTPEQKTKFEEMEKRRRESSNRHRSGWRGRGGTNAPQSKFSSSDSRTNCKPESEGPPSRRRERQ